MSKIKSDLFKDEILKKPIGIRHLWEARRGMTWAGVVAARAVRLDPASPCPCWPWHPGQCRDVVPVPVWQRSRPVPHWTSVTGELCWELERGGCPSPLAQRGRFMLCRCWVLLPSYVLELHPKLLSAHPSPCQPPAVVRLLLGLSNSIPGQCLLPAAP